jgi:hypothetical protein
MSSLLANLHPEHRIDSIAEKDRLEAKLHELITQSLIDEIAVKSPEHPLQEEHWYQDKATGEVYRYIPPNFPARGSWEKVQ